MNLPNILTLIRISMIPVFILVYYLPVKWAGLAAAVIFALAAFTDLLDGYLARKLNQMTPFGAFLDPVADKLMVAVALVVLTEVHATPLMAVPAAVIIGREIVISALREWMAELGKRASVAVSYVGKVKTVVQMVAIILLVAIDPLTKDFFYYVGFTLLDLAVVLTLWSMVMYLRAAWPELRPQVTAETDAAAPPAD